MVDSRVVEGILTMSEPLSLAPASVDNPPPGHTKEDGVSGPGGVIPVWSIGLSADRVGPIQWRSVAGLKPYAPRFIEVPSFRDTPNWEMLRQLLKESGVRDPLLVLPDGRVRDGVHRLELARALGLTEVPVRVVDVPEPCSASERMQLETARAALDAGRRRIVVRRRETNASSGQTPCPTSTASPCPLGGESRAELPAQ